ncbi:MAG: L,D-transpeptidase [Rhodoplanes sp.]
MHTKYLVVLAIGLAAFAAPASAQSFPPGPYSAPDPYRGAPMDDGYDGPGGADPTYEAQPLPPPGVAAEPAVPAPPPATSYRNPTAYPADRPGPAPRGDYVTGANSGWEPIRPPGDISAPRANGPYAAPAAPTSPPADAPTGAIVVPKTSPASNAYAAFPPDYRPEEGKPKQLSPHLQRQIVTYPTPEPAGTIIVDTPNTFLYLVLGDGKAMRYGIGVGREGFTWSGVERVSKMAEWPDWHPPPEMIERQPYLPRFMAGGESSPLGARALYLGKSIYRIHGTNQPSTIGTFVSSGCIRLTNADIEDLYRRVTVGTRVVVLAGKPNHGQKQGPGSAAELPSSSQVIR